MFESEGEKALQNTLLQYGAKDRVRLTVGPRVFAQLLREPSFGPVSNELGQFGQDFADVGQTWPKCGNALPKWPVLVKGWSMLIRFSQHRPQPANQWPLIWPHWFLPTFGRTRPASANIFVEHCSPVGPTCGPNLANIGREVVQLSRMLTKVGQPLRQHVCGAQLGQCCSNLGRHCRHHRGPAVLRPHGIGFGPQRRPPREGPGGNTAAARHPAGGVTQSERHCGSGGGARHDSGCYLAVPDVTRPPRSRCLHAPEIRRSVVLSPTSEPQRQGTRTWRFREAFS